MVLVTVRRADSCKMDLLIRERIVNATKVGVVFYPEPVAMSTTSCQFAA